MRAEALFPATTPPRPAEETPGARTVHEAGTEQELDRGRELKPAASGAEARVGAGPAVSGDTGRSGAVAGGRTPGLLGREEALEAARDAVRRSRIRRSAREREAPALPGTRTRTEPSPAPPKTGGGQTVPEQAGPVGESAASPRPGGRLRAALLERLPLWAQLRCGMGLRTFFALLFVLLVALGFAVHHFWSGRPQPVRAPEAGAPPSVPPVAPRSSQQPSAGNAAPASAGPSAQRGGTAGQRVVVDVAGKVRKPGIYRLPAGSRVADALEEAGGLRPGTDSPGLNRARRLADGERIVAGATPGPGVAGAPGGMGGASGGGGTGAVPVSLNSGTPEQLKTLPGVGPALAQRIIAFRRQHGGFRSVDQLQDVSGIGERRFADLEPRVQL